MKDDPANVLGSIAVSVTVTLMFGIVWFIVPLLQPYSNSIKLASTLIGIIGAAGFYRTVSAFLWGRFRRWQWLRRLVLRRRFLEGTWIGHYLKQGGHVITVEYLDQESGFIHIQGRELHESGQTLSTWESYAASLDYGGDHLVYAYNCDVYSERGQHQGIGSFRLIRRSKRKPPDQLDGYAADLTDSVKDVNREFKLGTWMVSDAEAWAGAKRHFGF